MFLASAVLVTASAAQQEAADRRRMVDDVDAMLASAAGKLGVAKLGRLTSRDPHCKAGKLERAAIQIRRQPMQGLRRLGLPGRSVEPQHGPASAP